MKIKPKDGYQLKELKVNGLNVVVENNKFELSNIDKNYVLEISFKEIDTSQNETTGLDNTTQYIIYGGIGLIVMLLCAIIIIIVFKKKSSKKS